MTTLTLLLASFNGGEWAEELHGRSDIQKYPNSARVQSNFISLPEGSLKPRPGTRYVIPTKNNAVGRIIPFEFSLTQAYVLEFTNLKMRVFKDNGIVEATPGVPYELTTPYTTAMLPSIKWAQSNDILYLVCPGVAPMKLTRTSHINWTLVAIDFQDGPYLEANVSTTELTPSGTSGSVTISSSAPVFTIADVGRHVRIRHVNAWGWAKITAFSTSTSVTANVISPFGAATAAKEWRLGAWTAALGYPTVVIFYEQRLCYANNQTQPQTLWLSETGNFETFSPSKFDNTIVDSNAVTYTIDDNQVHNIQWLSSSEKLTIGTSSGEFAAQASTLNEALTPDNITIRNKSRLGSANVLPVLIEQSTIFVQTSTKSIYEFVFDNIDSAVNSTETSIFSKHMIRSGVKEIIYQKKPWNLIWGCCQNGTLFAVTFLKEQEVLAFHRHPLGGQNVKVLSLATIPNIGGNQVWMIVERTVNNATVRYVEYMTDEYVPEDEDDKDGYVYMDSSLEYSGPPVTYITGLDHLAGQEVQILANGATHPNKFVGSDGSLTLDRPVTIAQIGLPTESVFEPLPLEPVGQFGSTLQQKKRIDRVAIILSKSLGGIIGDGQDQFDIMERRPANPMDSSPPLFSGKIIVNMPNENSETQTFVIKRTQPLPLNILAISPRLTITEDPTG